MIRKAEKIQIVVDNGMWQDQSGARGHSLLNNDAARAEKVFLSSEVRRDSTPCPKDTKSRKSVVNVEHSFV